MYQNTVTLPDELAAAFDASRFRRQCVTWTEAMRRLVADQIERERAEDAARQEAAK